MLRFLDLSIATIGLILGLPVLLFLFVLGLFDTGSPLFFQKRVGRFQRPFVLVKFRTMKPGVTAVATHLADPEAITRFPHVKPPP